VPPPRHAPPFITDHSSQGYWLNFLQQEWNINERKALKIASEIRVALYVEKESAEKRF
jgi:hypothetical protein